ncbi:MAG: hypothetical protein FJ295_19230 [Planctomycetes bacterium]|nr:hypothetical protein [Planctomycetota bacterium]
MSEQDPISQHPAPPTALRFSLALFVLSMAVVLFSLSLFRLISFFIMPSLFFDLLLVCFPIGAALAVWWKGEPSRRFGLALPLLQLVMVVTVVATLLLKHVDFMRGGLFNVDTTSIMIQVAIFSAIYAPFFVAYGATEYLGYLTGREVLKHRMNGVYALVLFGAAGGFVVSLLQESVGVARLLVLSIGMLTAVKLALSPRWRVLRGLEALALIAVLAYPGTSRDFMLAFKSSKPNSAAHYKAIYGDSVRSLYEGWGRYSYFEVMKIETGEDSVLWGFYNDMNQWGYRQGTLDPGFRETVLQPFVTDSRNIVIIGSGGGRDVKLVRSVSGGKIVAMDVEPAVFRVTRGLLREEFEDVYSQPGVEVIAGDARTYLEKSSEKYDAIFFWSVGGYPQLMLEPGNMIRTKEALGGFVRHLSPNGVFCMGYDRELDPQKVLLRQYAMTLQMHGAKVVAFEHGTPPVEFCLIAYSPDADPAQLAHWKQVESTVGRKVHGNPIRKMRDEELFSTDFSPVTDDRPYLAGNIASILSIKNVRTLFYQIGAALVLVCVVIYFLILAERKGGGAPNFRVQFLALLLGANFLMLEHICVLEIFRKQYIYYDAIIVGVVAFLTITGLGSLLINNRTLRWAILLSWIGPVIWLLQLNATGAAVTFAAMFLATLVTGNMFPAVFEAHPQDRLHIFALDAIGAAGGAMISFFMPILYGMTAFRVVALAVFLLTTVVMLLVGPRALGKQAVS